MSSCLTATGKEARGFDDNVHPQLAPRQPRWIFLAEHGDIPSIDLELAFANLDSSRKDSIGRVITKQVSVRMQVGHVVYGDDIELFFVTLEHRAQSETADPTESIDRYIGHLSSCRFLGEVVAG